MIRQRWLILIACACVAGMLWGQDAPRPPAPPVAPATAERTADAAPPAPPAVPALAASPREASRPPAPPPPSPPALQDEATTAAPEDLARLEADSAADLVREKAARQRAEIDALRFALKQSFPLEPADLAAAKRELEEKARAVAGEATRLHGESPADLARENAAHMRSRADALRALAQVKRAPPSPAAAPTSPTPPAPPTPPKHPRKIRTESSERAYERGQRALDGRRWTEALEAFTMAASKTGSRAEGALYWKAYTLNKLGRRDEALEAVAELRKSFPSSRWLEDAKILEAEIRQASGQPVRPESETDDDIKLLALNGLIHSEPERAVPLLENLLKSSHSPRLKERALFVLAQSGTPRGKQLLEQVARGGAGNPDLQLKAVRYLGASGRKGENGALLWEIYSGAGDLDVRRAALAGFGAARDKDHLLQIVRTEKSPQLRLEAIGMLGATGSENELWQIYQQESSNEVKLRILESMHAAVNAERLLELVRTEKEASLRRAAVRALARMATAQTGDSLASLYAAETDAKVKSAILDGLHERNNAKALVELARKESDPKLKREIVSRLSRMKSKDASEYLLELLK